MVKKTEQAFGELAGSVEAILTLYRKTCKGLSGNLLVRRINGCNN